MDKTYTKAKAILDRILRNTDERVDDGYGIHSMDRRKAQIGLIEADVVTNLTAQIAIVTSLLKTMALNNSEMVDPAAQMNTMN